MKCMTILLVEDDVEICKMFEDYIKTRNDVKLIAITNSSETAMEIVKDKRPSTIILDLQLHNGNGSGYDFLEKIKVMDIPYSPIIAVNTNVNSDKIYKKLNNHYADFIFYKKQPGYSPKLVIDDITFLGADDGIIEEEPIIQEIFENQNKRIVDMINVELDTIGINYKLKGREYLFECLYALLQGNINSDYSILQHVAKKYKVCSNTIGRTIQTVINDTWRTSSLEHLHENYKAKINYNTGVPTPTEFIYYYFKRIKDTI